MLLREEKRREESRREEKSWPIVMIFSRLPLQRSWTDSCSSFMTERTDVTMVSSCPITVASVWTSGSMRRKFLRTNTTNSTVRDYRSSLALKYVHSASHSLPSRNRHCPACQPVCSALHSSSWAVQPAAPVCWAAPQPGCLKRPRG